MTFLAAKPRVWTNLSSSRHSYRNLSPHLGCAEDNNPDCQLLRPARFFAMHEIRLRCEIKAGADSNLRHVSSLEFKAPSHFCWGSCRTETQQVLLQSLRNNCMPTEDNHAEPTRQIQAEPVANRVCKAQHRHHNILTLRLCLVICKL